MYDFSHKLLLWLLCVKNHSHILMGHVNNRWWGDNNMEGVNFRHFYFIYMASMTNDKVTWLFNCHYNDLKRLKIIWYEHRQPYLHLPTYFLTQPPSHPFINFFIYLPTHLPTHYLLAYPTTYLPTYLLPKCQPTRTWPTHLPAHPSTHPFTYLPIHPLTYLPTYLLFPIFSNLLTYYLISYNLSITYVIIL
jgi:hypothetical protein